MSKDEAMTLALEALEMVDEAMPFPVAKLAQAALREALAEQPAQQEPVKGAALNKDGGVTLCKNGQEESIFGFAGRLFTSPPAQRTWVSLTDEDKQHIHNETGASHSLICLVESAIEAKLKEKNT